MLNDIVILTDKSGDHSTDSNISLLWPRPPFREYWRSVGSVQIFGLPIDNAFAETSYTDGATYLTQWTERERLEQHPELAGTRYEILLGLLAKEDLRQRGYLEK